MQHNRLYKDSIIDRNFTDRCKVQEPPGHDFFITKNDCPVPNDENKRLYSEDDKIF